VAATEPAPVNVVPAPTPPAALPYTITFPTLPVGTAGGLTGAIGIVRQVLEGVSDPIVNTGHIGHWPGTGFAGEQSHMVLFGHRTEHGGPLRELHLLGAGDRLHIDTRDGRRFTYEYRSRHITGQGAEEIYNAGLHDGTLPSVEIVACSQPNELPTNTKYRLILTFSLIDVEGDPLDDWQPS
jgi:sortase (surface protein transpeptidase)